jgi:hypothetical protein
MKQGKLKSLCLFISTFLAGIFYFPFAFAKNIGKTTHTLRSVISDSSGYFSGLHTTMISVYDSLMLNYSGLNRMAFDLAQKGFEKLKEQGEVFNDAIISIIDFSLPSSEKRLFIIDLKNYKLLFNTYVAHGRNSGKEFANSFSNKPSSFKSSLGFYITGNTYNGENGFSLKLEGLEKGINDNAGKRAIVMHGADYVNESFLHAQGYMGRSLGCPAVSKQEYKEVINIIKDRTCLFIFSPDKNYISHSPVLN